MRAKQSYSLFENMKARIRACQTQYEKAALAFDYYTHWKRCENMHIKMKDNRSPQYQITKNIVASLDKILGEEMEKLPFVEQMVIMKKADL